MTIPKIEVKTQQSINACRYISDALNFETGVTPTESEILKGMASLAWRNLNSDQNVSPLLARFMTAWRWEPAPDVEEAILNELDQLDAEDPVEYPPTVLAIWHWLDDITQE